MYLERQEDLLFDNDRSVALGNFLNQAKLKAGRFLRLKDFGAEFYSSDKRRNIVVEYYYSEEEDAWVKNIEMHSVRDKRHLYKMMRVQVAFEKDIPEPQYSVDFDALIRDKEGCVFYECFYSDLSGGILGHSGFGHLPGKRPDLDDMTFEETAWWCRDQVEEEGIYYLEELRESYPRINVAATVKAFTEQIKNRDYSQPRLIRDDPGVLLEEPHI